MRIVILQHSDSTPPGTVLDWIKVRGYSYRLVRPDRGDALPDLKDFDLLFVLGGAMNVDEEGKHDWLKDEKRFLREVIAGDKLSVGLCLGGQLLAEALGARVYKQDHWEVGWHPVQLENGVSLPFFQYHRYAFELPIGASRLATNSITPNQAFAYKNVFGFQFHPEASDEWVRDCVDDVDYPQGLYVESKESVLQNLNLQSAAQDWFFNFLNSLSSGLPSTKKVNG